METYKRPWSPPQMIWSALIATVVWTAIGFSWFGYGLDWSTPVGAERMVDQAVVEGYASICVAQARASTDAAAEIEKLKALALWKRRDFVEEADWAVMPGSEEARSGVADLCSEKLLAT